MGPTNGRYLSSSILIPSRILISGQLGASGKLPDVPMVVLTSLRSVAAQGLVGPRSGGKCTRTSFQSVTYGMHIVTNRSGHLIQQGEPQLVLNAVRWLLMQHTRRVLSPAPPNVCCTRRAIW